MCWVGSGAVEIRMCDLLFLGIVMHFERYGNTTDGLVANEFGS